VDTVEYASGREADIYGDPAQRTILMWHGAQTNARVTMRPLAERLAGHGAGVVVADWDSHADDRGRSDLLRSLQFARDRSADPDSLVLVGWSLGGVAAAAATVRAAELQARFAHTVCLAGAFHVPDPIFNANLPTDLSEVRDRTPFTLLHGAADDVIPLTVSQEFATTLRRHDWPVEIAELDTDHGAIAGAVYDSGADRYAPADDARTLDVVADVAERVLKGVAS
jgi:dienelactone hydrolase